MMVGWWLVVSTYPSEKYEFVNGKDDNPYMKWKIQNVPNHKNKNKINPWWFIASPIDMSLVIHANAEDLLRKRTVNGNTDLDFNGFNRQKK